jgi:hypothetical protein
VPIDADGLERGRNAGVRNPNQICENCQNPKSHHHYKDAFCLLVMKWKPEEFKHLGTDEEFAEYLSKLPK